MIALNYFGVIGVSEDDTVKNGLHDDSRGSEKMTSRGATHSPINGRSIIIISKQIGLCRHRRFRKHPMCISYVYYDTLQNHKEG